jgi:hypothetical protein
MGFTITPVRFAAMCDGLATAAPTPDKDHLTWSLCYCEEDEYISAPASDQKRPSQQLPL